MDFQRQFPFYTAYPQYQNWNQISEDRVLEDLEYLQQMYPSYAKRYQVIINDMLNRMDYDGSVIYDQYPDRWQLDRIVRTVLDTIRLEENRQPQMQMPGMSQQTMEQDNMRRPEQMPQSQTEQNISDAWLRELVTVLLYYEILKRRRKRQNLYIF